MERAGEERRSDIVKAALEVFARYGFARAQVNAVAELSHVSTATIYKMFDSKEALFRAAYEQGMFYLQSLELRDDTIPDPVEALRHVAVRYAETLNSPMIRRIARMQIAQNTTPAGEGRAQGASMRAVVENSFRPALERCAAAGLIDPKALYKARALITGFIEHQTLTFGLIIEEDETGPFSGPELAHDAVRAALLAYPGRAATSSPA